MKLSRLTKLAFAAALTAPAAMQAQVTQQLTFNGPNTLNGDAIGSYVTGPYSVTTVLGGNTFDVFCIDADNAAQSGQFTARYVSFADAVGMYNAGVQRALGEAFTIQELRAAAYLSAQFSTSPAVAGANNDSWDDIHGSIWNLFSPNASFAGYAGGAAAAITAAGNDGGYDNDWVLVIDERAFDAQYTGPLQQAFLTDDGNTVIRVVTPEPGTYALMGAGLFVVGFVSRRRRSLK
ncbi:MAG: PEP-CTERM sorting domain-containing protein [Gemmatimonas sp.]